MDFLSHYISEPLIHALGWTVLHSLWQGSLVAIVMALILSNLQKKSARLRYEIASLSLFLVFILSLSTFILLYESAEQQAAQAFYPEESFLLMQLEVQTSFFQDSLQRGVEYFNQSLPLIVTFWLVGALFFAMRLLGGLAYVQHLKYNDNELLPDFWQDQMRRLARQLRMKQHIELLESRLVTVPMVIGFFKPVILLPLGAINSLTEKEVEAILAHELAHIARYDFLLNIVLSLIEVLFYYHPAVWWISANVRLERENCCDDVAVQLCGNSLVYAKALVSLQEMSRHQPIPTFAMTLLGSQHQLLNRVKRILNQPQTRSNIMEKLTATCLLLFTLGFLSISAKSPADHSNMVRDLLKEGLTLPESGELYVVPDDELVIEEILENDWIALIDTLPRKRAKRQRITRTEEGTTYEIIMEQGDIDQVIVNGEVVPEEEFEEYDFLWENLEEIPLPPAPPTPPSPSSAVAPPPPAPPTLYGNAYQTWVGGNNQTQTISTKKGSNGETIIMIEKPGDETMEIIVQPGEEDGDLILIDGTAVGEGDTLIIRDHNQGSTNKSGMLPSRNGVGVWSAKGYSLAPETKANQEEMLRMRELRERLTVEKKALRETYASRLRDWRESLEGKDGDLQEELRNLIEEQEVAVKNLEREMKQLQDDRLALNQEAHREALQAERARHKEFTKRLREERKAQRRAQQKIRKKHRQRTHQHRHSTRHKLHTDVHFDQQGYFDSEIREAFEAAMLEDGLIDEQRKYKLELTRGSFQLDGKKQSNALLEKYIAIYENLSGYELTGKSKIEVRSNQ